jgi:hypothetical protein
MRCPLFATVIFVLASVASAQSQITLDKSSLSLSVGDFYKLKPSADASTLKFTSADPKIAVVYANGYVIALVPGNTTITASPEGGQAAICNVRVTSNDDDLIDPATLKQYPDDRVFMVGERKCVGTVLNGHMVGNEQNPRVDRNRVLNPKPLDKEHPLEWELEKGAPVYDGTGTLMGTTAPGLKVGEKKLTSTKINYGFSKIIEGKLCLYGFNVDIAPGEAVRALLPDEERKKTVVPTSAWVPLDAFVDKLTLLDCVGLGKGKLPRLPLLATRYKITGGNPKQYETPSGELAIVDNLNGPVPSHYLRRPTGTVNILYTMPGYYIGGHSLDSLLVTSNATFRPARGVRAFPVATYYPKKHPQEGKKSPRTMTFIYGAVEAKGTETIYGWIAKEALVPAR